MELQTWTRKANAEKAVQKLLAEVATDAHMITGIEAADIGAPLDAAAFAVKVFCDNTASEVADLQAALGNKAEVVAEREEEQPVEVELHELGFYGLGTDEATAECPHCGTNHVSNGYAVHDDDYKCDEMKFACLGCGGEWGPRIKRRKSFKRAASLSGKKMRVVGGGTATNPYRVGSKSHEAFELVRNNPDLTFEEFKKLGGRVRTLQEDVKAGRVRAK